MAIRAALAHQDLLAALDRARRLSELQRVEVREQILPVRFGCRRRRRAVRGKLGPHGGSMVPQRAGQRVGSVGWREALAQVAGNPGSLVSQALPANRMALLAAL